MQKAARNTSWWKFINVIIDLIILFAFGKTAFLCVSAVFLFVCVIEECRPFLFDLYRNKALIWKLAKNDFKTKYAGSSFGILWAFVQPVVTIMVYWFVFQVGFRQAPFAGFPYVLWLISGLVPWFFFQEALNSGTNCLIEYSYLVKKVVFNFNILPVIKIISALFVHIFFTCFMMVIFALFGFFPDVYYLQIGYYLFAMLILILGVISFTCSIVVFFRDLGQLIQILLQVGIWLTPIMWNLDMIPPKYEMVKTILKCNPMYYIVNGYRSSMIHKQWFWEQPVDFCVFWVVTLGLLWLGMRTFAKLRMHFADVL